MKNLITFTSLFLLFCSTSFSSDLAIIAEAPNTNLNFVQDLLEEQIIVDEDTKDQFSTKWFSILSKTDIKSVALIETDTKKLTYENITPILVEAAQHAPVVLANVTPEDGYLCLQMKKQTETLFVLPVADFSRDLNRTGVKWCQAPNLLFVGGLKNHSRYLHTANYGNEYVRAAAPAHNIKIIKHNSHTGVWTSSKAATAIVSAQAALYAKKFPNLKGYKLAHSFLKARTKRNRALSPYVKSGRVVFKDSYRN